MSRVKIIRRYLYAELLMTSLLCTLVIMVVLIYGNFTRFADELLIALQLSPLFFLEMVSLLIPYALSLALPFGYALSVLFCVGKWSADREIIAMNSLGLSSKDWILPLLKFSLVVTLLACYTNLQWAPLARLQFENKQARLAWSNFDHLIAKGEEFSFKIDQRENSQSLEKFSSFVKGDLDRISLYVGSGNERVWKNVRILLWGSGQKVKSVIHAKHAEVEKNPDAGKICLFLHEVDVESISEKASPEFAKERFMSLRKWKNPIELMVNQANARTSNPKTIPISVLLPLVLDSTDLGFLKDAWFVINKKLTLGCSPFFLSFALIPVAISKGRRETVANLLWGIIICLSFYGLGMILSQAISGFGLGWWINALVFAILGLCGITRI